MNRSDTFLESCEPEGFEHEMMIAGKMIFDPVRGRSFSGGVCVVFILDAFGIRKIGRLEDWKTVGLEDWKTRRLSDKKV